MLFLSRTLIITGRKACLPSGTYSKVSNGAFMKRLIFTLAVIAAMSAPCAAASLTRNYSYFAIQGNSLEELERQLHSKGPQLNGSPEGHPGATTMDFTSRIRYRQESNRCAIDDVDIVLRVDVTLPRWRNGRRADQELRLIWDTLASDIKRHEESHISIAKRYARLIEDTLRSLPRRRTCEQLADDVRKSTDELLARHDEEQDQFDRVESMNFESRIQRLLDYRMEQIENGRLRY